MIEVDDSRFTEITASLEGMKVVIANGRCELYEYNFDDNRWHEVDSSPWPVTRQRAERWLRGWNAVDRFAAFNRLVEAEV